jgi:(p)ppGpp synthase/HD superfamily hydrolase
VPDRDPAVAPDRLAAALHLAAEVHAHQWRKGTSVPYISHPLAVAALVLEHGGDEDLAIAALLHDAVEDADPAVGGERVLARVEAEFGERVAEVVLGCSDTTVQPKPPWRERKERYLEHLRVAGPDTLVVSAADKLHNLRTLIEDLRREGPRVWSRFNAGEAQQVWYLTTVVERLRDRLPGHSLVAGLDAALDELRILREEYPGG